MDISAILINKLLSEKNLDIWAKLKLAFLDPSYSSLYTHINRYYTHYSSIPSFDELEVTVRELPVAKTLATLRLLDETDVTAEVALDALIDQYTQNQCILLLDKFIDKLPIYDSSEIKESLASIVLTLDEKTLSAENVFTMAEVNVFQRPEELARTRMHLGLNNTFDSVLNGVARQELILIGGKRGSGKSIISSNILCSQYEAGLSSVYFTIEMIAHEVLQRNISILANVDHRALKKNELTDGDLLKVVKCRAEMFTNADKYVQEFVQDRDQYKFEDSINRYCELKPDNQMVIVDDRKLSLSSIDLHLGKMKAKFGEKFGVAVIDYLNQIVIEGAKSQFDWQPQVDVSKKLKELARKYDIVIISPYQIDATGEARFAKGILDAADIAMTLEPHNEDSAISMETTKIRGDKAMKFTSGMNWDTLRISPIPIDKPASKEKPKDKIPRAGKKDEAKPTGESAAEVLPWED
jgi:replicative DNA helicase